MEKATSRRRGLILVPYAYKSEYNTGVNIRSKKTAQDVYLKNCCVACVSAKHHAGSDTDVALISNIEPPREYRNILEKNGVKIIRQDFDLFNFGGKYTWSLAFYKLCALYHAVRNLSYGYYAFVDTDVYFQADFENIWKECDSHVLLYDINHGLQVEHYRHFLQEISDFREERTECEMGGGYAVHYGGEFFAANAEKALEFTQRCEEIYSQMIKRDFTTTHGDEFITSLAAARMKNSVKNAGAYVFRFWTGPFRLVSTCYQYNPVAVLHVPAEKERGMLRLFDKFIQAGKIPTKEQAHKILHLRHRSLRTIVAQMILKLRKKR